MQSLFKEVKYLLIKDWILEWRQKYALNGIVLYVASTVFIVHLSFLQIQPAVWITLFWIIMLFASVNAITKSFIQESGNRFLYYYTIVRPEAVILAKMLYNTGLMLLLGIISLFFYAIVAGNPIVNYPLFFISLVLWSVGFSISFTLISSIAAKTESNMAIMSILSFPVIIPILIMLIKLSQKSLIENNMVKYQSEIVILLALDAILISVAFLLFPFIWRD